MKLNRNSKKAVEEIANTEMRAKTILVIKTRPVFKAEQKGLNLNEGYEFEVNGAIPELADSIAKLAKELPANDFGQDSDKYFLTLIMEYFKKL